MSTEAVVVNDQTMNIRWRWIFLAAGCLLMTSFTYIWSSKCSTNMDCSVCADKLSPSTKRILFNGDTKDDENTEIRFRSLCIPKNNDLTFERLEVFLANIRISEEDVCRAWLDRFDSIFNVVGETAKIKVPTTLQEKAKQWLKTGERTEVIKTQSIIKIKNIVTGDSTIHNILRARRPVAAPSVSQFTYINSEYLKSRNNCDFCNYTRYTAEDSFGRIENTNAYSAANLFQLDKLHSMSVFRNHHPLNWTMEQFKDVFSIAAIWFDKAYALNKAYPYPVIYWDLLPKSGGSQVHPHIHMLLSRLGFPGNFDMWDRAADKYEETHSKKYFDSLIYIHKCLGLTVEHGSSTAFASLTPKRDYEIVITSDSFNQVFVELLFYCIRVYIEEFNNYAFSLAVRVPPMNQNESEENIPLYARLVSRGVVSTVRSDVSSMELFTISSSNVDPFDFIKRMKTRINRMKSV